MKLKNIITVFLLSPLYLFGQYVNAVIDQGEAVISYSVLKGEDVDAIATKFDVSTEKILELNKLQPGTALQEDQKLKVPISKRIQPSCKENECKKVYYRVQASEGLYRVGKNFGDIAIPELVKLNKLPSETVSVGQVLLVGYLPKNLPTAKSNTAKIENTVSAESKPVEVVPVAVAEKKQEPVQPATNVATEKNTSTTQLQPVSKAAEGITVKYVGRGVFETQFATSGNEATMQASIFRTASGWNDGKYYLLIDAVVPGTVVKLKSPSSENIVYAKVLGELPKLKDSDPAKVFISNAASAALGINVDDNFQVTVSW